MNSTKPLTVCLIAFACELSGAARASAGLWKLSEFNGPTAFDSSAANNGTYHGDISYRTPAPGGFGVTLHGVGDPGYMEVDNVPLTASISVIAWAKSATPTWNSSGWIISDRDANGFIIHPNEGSSSVGFYVISNGLNFYVPIANWIPVDDITKWHQYALTFDAYPNPDPIHAPQDAYVAGFGRAYIDGVEVAGVSLPYLHRFAEFPYGQIYVGQDDPRASGTQNRYGDGSVYHAVVNSAIGAEEILADYNSTINGVPEPAGLLLMSIGALALVGHSWRRRYSKPLQCHL